MYDRQDMINSRAMELCQDENDRKLLDPETYTIHSKEWDSVRLEAAGRFGDYVEIDDFHALAERFLLAMELIKTMEDIQTMEEA